MSLKESWETAVANDDENVLISPLGLNLALTALSVGTNGNTLNEFRKTLHQPEDEFIIETEYKEYAELIEFVLVNTVYFNANWTQPFDSIIENVTFYGKDKKFKINALTTESIFLYKKDDELEAQLLQLPYQIGINEIFFFTSDFNRLSKPGFAVSNIVHKTFIEVTEWGTRAAADIDLKTT
ncbi:serine protease inhibitor A3N-like [Lycorma delicatula]|uniref:serine protease inhibitor A3N-like n=1 Tax=Lycorma delicatula TaxID=130591 RepID=UPI003F5168B0